MDSWVNRGLACDDFWRMRAMVFASLLIQGLVDGRMAERAEVKSGVSLVMFTFDGWIIPDSMLPCRLGSGAEYGR
jgi:hypothetical protein